MIDKSKIVILMTAFNEEKVIESVLSGLLKHGYKNIVLVDDGSNDETSKVAGKFNIYLLRHIINRGKGASLQTGTEFIMNKDFEVIVHFDADGQHNPEDIENLVKPIMEENFDVVFGSRFLGTTENIPFLRKIILKLGIFISNLLYGVHLTDVHNGLRAFKRDVFKKIILTEDRFAYASELLQKVVENRFKFKEVPVKIVYTKYSVSKGQKNLNALNIFFHMLKRRFFA